MSATAAARPRTASTKSHRGFRGDSSAMTVALLSMLATLIAGYDLLLLAVGIR